MAKIKIDSRYGIAPNSLLQRNDISWKAKGLYVYIQSKPDDWDFAIERMESSDGKDSTRSGIHELEKNGYLTRDKYRLPNGKYDYEYTLHSEPNHSGKSDTVTMAEKPPLENPTLENPPYIKERETKQEIQNKSISTIVDKEQALEAPQEYGKKEINEALSFLSNTIGIDEFKEPVAKQRQYANHIVKLAEKIGKAEFIERLKGILSDGFKKKNCNSIAYLYRELKSFIHEEKSLVPTEKKVINSIGVL